MVAWMHIYDRKHELSLHRNAMTVFLFHRKVRLMKQKGMRSFARGTKAAPAGKLGRGSVRSALLFFRGFQA